MNFLIQPFAKTCSYILYKMLKKEEDRRNSFIIYKIVDSCVKNNEESYKIQCINTKAIFSMAIQDIVFDIDILYGLHPIQGCFIGIEYAKIIKANINFLNIQEKQKNILARPLISRYGNNNLLYQDRSGFLGFECKNSGEQFLMEPRVIALSRELIEQFDVIQTVCIGILAGLKFVNPLTKI